MAEKTSLPSFLKMYTHNGRVRESHAPRSVIFAHCGSDECSKEETREFQISSVDLRRGVSVFRCVICGNKIEQ